MFLHHRLAIAAVAAGVLGAAALADTALPLTDRSVVCIATAEEGRDLLTQEDDFVRSLSPFDRASRMRSGTAVRQEQLVAYVAAQVRDWTPQERARLAQVIAGLRARLTDLNPNLPSVVYLVKTSGEEEGGANYTRGAAIVLSKALMGMTDRSDILEKVIAHEIFHIYTKHNPGRLAELYSILGFRLCDDIDLPEPMRSLKITNPDAPRLNVYIEVDYEGQPLLVAPVLLARSAYDSQQGGDFFRYMQLKLLALRRTQQGVALQLDASGQPRVFDPIEVPDYEKRASRNASYTIHPEEVLASGFASLVLGNRNATTPWVLDDLRRAVSQPRNVVEPPSPPGN